MKLFDPVSIGSLELKNQLIMTAMSTRLADPKGEITDRLTEYYIVRTACGVGIVTVEEASIDPKLSHVQNTPDIFCKHLVSGLKNLTKRVHRSSTSTSLQIGQYFRQWVSGFPCFITSADASDCGPGCMEFTPDKIRYRKNHQKEIYNSLGFSESALPNRFGMKGDIACRNNFK